jgi:hypothetical protein
MPVRSLLVGLVLCLACAGPEETAPKPERIFALDFRSSMELVRDCRLSPAEHDGFYIEVYASRRGAADYTEGRYPFEPGTLLVKGEYDDENCEELRRVSAMERLPTGDDPELHDWHWQRTDREGVVQEDTPARSCAGCHAACEATDFACTEP